jgi:hypothetical protein
MSIKQELQDLILKSIKHYIIDEWTNNMSIKIKNEENEMKSFLYVFRAYNGEVDVKFYYPNQSIPFINRIIDIHNINEMSLLLDIINYDLIYIIELWSNRLCCVWPIEDGLRWIWKRGYIDTDNIKEIEILSIKDDEENICSICFESLLNNKLLGHKDIKSEVYHLFHYDCLKKWKYKPCPTCRDETKFDLFTYDQAI